MGLSDNKTKNGKGTSSNPEKTATDTGCCYIRGPRWMMMPYDDYWIQSAQFLAVLCVFLSWVWWVTFLTSLLGNLSIQLIWCSRQTRAAMLVSAAAAVVCGLVSLGAGIWIAVVWSDYDNCQLFVPKMYSNDDDDPYYDSAWKHADHCREALWTAIAVVDGLIWFVVAGLIAWFVKSGRHAELEEFHVGKEEDRRNNSGRNAAWEEQSHTTNTTNNTKTNNSSSSINNNNNQRGTKTGTAIPAKVSVSNSSSPSEAADPDPEAPATTTTTTIINNNYNNNNTNNNTNNNQRVPKYGVLTARPRASDSSPSMPPISESGATIVDPWTSTGSDHKPRPVTEAIKETLLSPKTIMKPNLLLPGMGGMGPPPNLRDLEYFNANIHTM